MVNILTNKRDEPLLLVMSHLPSLMINILTNKRDEPLLLVTSQILLMFHILTNKRDEPLLLVTSQTLLASAGTDLLLLFCRPFILTRKLKRGGQTNGSNPDN
jgi:hypothetical protein